MEYLSCLQKMRRIEGPGGSAVESGGDMRIIFIFPHFYAHFGLWLFGFLTAIFFGLAVLCGANI